MGSRPAKERRVTRLLIAACLFVLWPAIVLAACSDTSVQIRGPFGEARFSVEVADTPAERARGLMFREEMPKSAGMLFLYKRPSRLSFWMRNTFIELDLLFLDSRGVIQHVHHRAQPHDETPIDGGRGVAVLEINGGLAKAMGISKGDELRHPFFAEGPPAWPC